MVLVYIRAANPTVVDLNKHIVFPDARYGVIFQPEILYPMGYNCFHDPIPPLLKPGISG
jgi:hypothetical protein